MTAGEDVSQNEDTRVSSEKNAQAKGYWRTWAEYPPPSVNAS